MVSCPACKKAGAQRAKTVTGLVRETLSGPIALQAEIVCECGARLWSGAKATVRQASFHPSYARVTRGQRILDAIASRRGPASASPELLEKVIAWRGEALAKEIARGSDG